MNKIDLIKEMRQKTGLGISYCKQYLEKNNYNINLAIYDIKKNFINLKINNNQGKEGIVVTKKISNTVLILKLICLTDFVSKNKLFIQLGNEILNYAFLFNNYNKDFLSTKLSKKINYLKLKFGENIYLDQINIFLNNYNYKYQHMNRIGAIITCISNNKIDSVLKQLSMHIVALNPIYISLYHISFNIFNDELKLIFDNLKDKQHLNNYFDIVIGKIKYFLNKNILISQSFLFNSKMNIFDFLMLNNYVILNFCRLEI